MSQFNKTIKSKPLARKISYNGNVQYSKRPEQELYDIVSSSLLGKDSYYRSSSETITRTKELIDELVVARKDHFVCNLIVHARTNLHIRAFPIMMIVELSASLRRANRQNMFIRSVVGDVVQRVDEITDLYAYAYEVFGDKKHMPLALLKGLADAFNKFDEYQFGKYKASKKAVSVKDVIRIVHPKAINVEQGTIFEKIVKETLATPYTWETELSAATDEKSKKDKWEQLIDSKKLGYMAALRNLRNMEGVGISKEHVSKICDYIVNPTAVAKSKQFPYRFLSAYSNINSKEFKMAIGDAMEHSLSNIPDLGDDIWLILDCSGSMQHSYYTRDTISPFTKSAMFVAALLKKHKHASNMRVTLFSNEANHVDINPNSLLVDIVKQLSDGIYGGGTNLGSALDKRDSLGFDPKTIVLFSDMQVNSLHGSDREFLKDNSILKIAVNCEGYESTPASTIDNWLQVSGYSDSIFDYIHLKNSGDSILSKFSTKYYIGYDKIRSI